MTEHNRETLSLDYADPPPPADLLDRISQRTGRLRRRRRVLVGAGAAATTCAVLGLAISGHSLLGDPSRIMPAGAPVPPSSSSPEQVARMYLRAAKARDCDLTAALTLPHTWNWCDDPRLLDYRSVNPADLLPASQAGRDQECVGFYMYTHGSSDRSIPADWQPWSLCFVQTSAGWRVYDQGQGLPVYDYDQGEHAPLSTSPASASR